MIIQWPRLWLLWNHSSFFRSLPCGEWELFGVLGYDSGAPLDHQGGHICSEQDSWVFLVGAGRGWTLSFSLFLLDRAHSKRQKHWNIINSFLISLSPLFETRIPRSKERLFDYYRNRTDTAPHHTISPWLISAPRKWEAQVTRKVSSGLSPHQNVLVYQFDQTIQVPHLHLNRDF